MTLEAHLRSSVEGNVPDSTLIEWVEQIQCNLKDFSIIACDRTALGKCKMKQGYDAKSNKLADYPVGSMVSVRTPGLFAKFDDSWLGPYEVHCKVSPVTWEFRFPIVPRNIM